MTFLLRHSYNHLEKLIKEISSFNKKCWEIDVDNYSESNLEKLLEIADKIYYSLGDQSEHPTDTLITKIMLGVFGNIPAFDTNFCEGFKISNYLNKNKLIKIRNFYFDNKEKIDKIKIYTLDFTGKDTKYLYTKAKIIDMIGFIEGGG